MTNSVKLWAATLLLSAAPLSGALAKSIAKAPPPQTYSLSDPQVMADAKCVREATPQKAIDSFVRGFQVDTPQGKADSAFAETAITNAIVTCMNGDVWADARTEYITIGTYVALSVRAARLNATKSNVDVDAVDAWFDTQEEGFQTSFGSEFMSEKELVSHADRLAYYFYTPNLSEAKTDAKLAAIGGYVAMLVLQERFVRGLPLDKS
jgi:hypothetical protein